VGDNLRSTLASGVRVVPAQRVCFAVAPAPLAVLVALVTGHDHHDTDAWRQTYRLEHVRRTHHIRGERVYRVLVTLTHERLRGEVKHHFRLCVGHLVLEVLEVAHIPLEAADALSDPGCFKQIRCARRL